jgi:hypothetical protein
MGKTATIIYGIGSTSAADRQAPLRRRCRRTRRKTAQFASDPAKRPIEAGLGERREGKRGTGKVCVKQYFKLGRRRTLTRLF